MIQVFKTWGELPSSRPLLHAGYSRDLRQVSRISAENIWKMLMPFLSSNC